MSHTVHIDPILLGKVSKPARYIGGEWNSVVKDHQTVKLTVAYAFPDVYEVSMSIKKPLQKFPDNYGFAILAVLLLLILLIWHFLHSVRKYCGFWNEKPLWTG